MLSSNFKKLDQLIIVECEDNISDFDFLNFQMSFFSFLFS